MKINDRLEQDWLLATEVHKLEARLWRKSCADGIKVILVTSAGRGEGKSTTVACLAAALGVHPDRAILAVDLDFREPSLNKHFQVDVSVGFGAVLRGERAVAEAIIPTELPNLSLLLPDSEGEDPGLLFRTSLIADIFEDIRKSHDLILVDAPALLPVADTAGLLPFVDGIVLMAMAGRTTRQQLSRAREICVGMETKILGLVVGNLQEAIGDHAGSGYKYGYGYGYHKTKGNGDGGVSVPAESHS